MRMTSQITPGISAKYPSPANSVISEMPGPDVADIARAPAQPAPSTMPIAAISSSAWITAQVGLPSSSERSFGRYSFSASMRLVDGVIGYHAATVTPPKIAPSAPAVLPSISTMPSVRSIRSTRYGSFLTMFSRTQSATVVTTP